MAQEQKSADDSENKKVEGDAQGGEDPSMEDILKSIRGVISGDEEAEAVAAADTDSEEDDEILELIDMAEESPSEEKAVDGGGEEEPMELTEAAPDGGGEEKPAGSEASEDKETTEDKEAEDDDKSVLDNIDEALGEAEDEAAAEGESVAAEGEAGDDDVLEAGAKEEGAAAEGKEDGDVLEAAKEAVDGGNVASEAESAERLLKEKVADESSETLKTLVANLPKSQIDSPYTAGGITLEQLTIEAMRPFLAEWLNENLPVIVKQIVTKEIKKLIPEEDDK